MVIKMNIHLPKDIFPYELFNFAYFKNNLLIINLGNRILEINAESSSHFYLNMNKNDETIWFLGFSDINNKIIYTNYKSIFIKNIKDEKSYEYFSNLDVLLLKYCNSSNEIVYISGDLKLERIDLESKKVIYSKKIEYDSTYDPIDLSNDNKYLAIEGDNNGNKSSEIVNVYDVETGNLIVSLSGFDIEDDKKHLEYQLSLEESNYFYPCKMYYQEYHEDYFSKMGTDKQFFIEMENFVKSILFSQDSKELLVYVESNNMNHVKIFDTDTWEVKERIYDYIKEDPVFMNDSNLIISFDSSYKTTNIYSRSQKKIIKTIDKILHFSVDASKYGNFITEDGEKYFEIKDIEEIFNE